MKPRTVTTAADLDALPVGSVVACISRMANIPVVIVFQRGSNNSPGVGWTSPDALGQISAEQVFEFVGLNGFPPSLTVLHEAGAELQDFQEKEQ